MKKILEQLSDLEKINIVVQSFIVGAGSIQAHNIYVYYLCKIYPLTPRQGGLLLRKCFTNLTKENKTKVVHAAYSSHLDQMKDGMRIEKKVQRKTAKPISNFEAAITSIESNLPVILGNKAFEDITPEEEEIISKLSKDFTPDAQSPVVQALRNISAKRNYYDGLKWRKNK